MRTYLDCIPCFFAQALKAARIAGADETTQKKLLAEVSKLVPDLLLGSTPPEMGRTVYQLVNKLTGNDDPFREIKKSSNQLILDLYPKLKMMVENSEDRLLTAIRLAAAGNIIDYGAPTSFEIEEEVANCLKRDFTVFDYPDFKQKLDATESVLYLGDNAGEVVFDRLLIEELGKNIIYVVRDKPIINDALIEDARDCGIDKIARVISSGSDAPGTVLNLCSREFMEIYRKAPLIISKGQGNFETLSEEKAPIFFLLKVKCRVIAKDIGCKVNDMILKSNLLTSSEKIFSSHASSPKSQRVQ